jgi:hypothetical protein
LSPVSGIQDTVITRQWCGSGSGIRIGIRDEKKKSGSGIISDHFQELNNNFWAVDLDLVTGMENPDPG